MFPKPKIVSEIVLVYSSHEYILLTIFSSLLKFNGKYVLL